MLAVRYGENVPLLWGWLAGEIPSKKYDRLYVESIGLGIQDSVRQHAARLCSLQREFVAIEQELYKLPAVPQFTRYRKVFARFGFGQRIEALLLSQIYPLQNYLAKGEPEIKICNGRRSGKATKRYLSLRRFMKALGCAPSHSWQWRHQQVESQRWLRLMSKSFVAVDIYADRTQTATIGKRHRLSPWGNVGF